MCVCVCVCVCLHVCVCVCVCVCTLCVLNNGMSHDKGISLFYCCQKLKCFNYIHRLVCGCRVCVCVCVKQWDDSHDKGIYLCCCQSSSILIAFITREAQEKLGWNNFEHNCVCVCVCVCLSICVWGEGWRYVGLGCVNVVSSMEAEGEEGPK